MVVVVVVVWLLCGCCVVVVWLLWCCCVSVFFMKAILSFCDFWTFFVVFFLSICALTFHKCQIVMKAILSFFDCWTIFCCFFLFICALTFHKCQIVKKAILSFLFLPFFFEGVLGAALLLFPLGFLCAFLFVFSLLFGFFWVPGDHGGGGRRGRGYDSGLGANYSGRGSL